METPVKDSKESSFANPMGGGINNSRNIFWQNELKITNGKNTNVSCITKNKHSTAHSSDLCEQVITSTTLSEPGGSSAPLSPKRGNYGEGSASSSSDPENELWCACPHDNMLKKLHAKNETEYMLTKTHETQHELTELTEKITAEINTLAKNEDICTKN